MAASPPVVVVAGMLAAAVVAVPLVPVVRMLAAVAIPVVVLCMAVVVVLVSAGAATSPPICVLRDRRACDIPLRAVLAASKAWCAMPIIGDGQLRAFAEGTNGQRQYSTAVSIERPLGIVPSLDQRATEVEHGSMTARANAFRIAAGRAGEHGADRSLRKFLLAISL